MTFTEKLTGIIARKQSYVCVGLDTDLAKIPGIVKGSPFERIFNFNKAVIDASAEHAAAFKLNSAFYEAEGVDGIRALEETLRYIPDDVVSIVDAKRGDIGNSAKQYAKAVFDRLGADAVTLNPYMGIDSVEPFLEYADKGSFILCLTSNKSSEDIQKLELSDGVPVFVHTARAIVSWNNNNNAGMVVGATHPEELTLIREIAPGMPLLIPGIGAQGGDLAKTVAAAIGKNREPVLINSSRGIIYRSSGHDFAAAAGAECLSLRNSINAEAEKL